jgi:putative phosphoesterase
VAGDIIGVISDTHGLLRPEAVATLRGAHLILHAGDVGKPEILDGLRALAPVIAVRGNIDRGRLAENLPDTQVVKFAGLYLYLLHDRTKLGLDPAAAGFSAVVFGHSHIPEQEMRKGVLYFNPGSAGPKRFALPISVGQLKIFKGQLEGKLIMIA